MIALRWLIAFLLLVSPCAAQNALRHAGPVGSGGGPPPPTCGGGSTWTDQTASGSQGWVGIGMSSNGHIIAATVNGGDLFLSADCGASWADKSAAGTRAWNRVAVSSNGSVIAAAYGGPTDSDPTGVVVSTNGGTTWANRTVTGAKLLLFISVSGDGTKIFVGDDGSTTSNNLYLSVNSGATFSTLSGTNIVNGGWFALVISRDGSTLVASSVDFTGFINNLIISTNDGASFSNIPPQVIDEMQGLCVSSDGTSIDVIGNNFFWTSTNSGGTWASAAVPDPAMNQMVGSDDLTHLLVIGTDLYISTNSGGAWTAQGLTTQSWDAIASSADGSRLAATDTAPGDVWTRP